ncbi:MAG: cutinase family protein [Gordonia sp. (in: high G+C Gram-positive bacteria)]|uniref:cutinase family protein n=1 Tax=Gordonia sp. (in: high G+C Gram-positive bacteria) TaxID=84139 RepID=UPI0039E2B462
MIRRWSALAAAALFAATGVALMPTTASAAPCSDIHVVWARGTAEPGAPVGYNGQAFVEALRGQTPGKSLRVTGVRYAASDKFRDRAYFAHSVNNGVKVAQNEVKRIAAQCPRTRIVLGGYSQGAVVAGYALVDKLRIPPQYEKYAHLAAPPLPASVTRHLAAAIFFGAPSARFIRDVGAPPITIGGRFRGKTASFCAPGDTICNGAPVGGPSIQHGLYPFNGMTVAAASFVVRRL